MYPHKHLTLKPLQSENPDSMRLYEQARDACRRLNGYLFDFIETITILREHRSGDSGGNDDRHDREIDEYIVSVEQKIERIAAQMADIAGDLSFLVDLVEFDSVGEMPASDEPSDSSPVGASQRDEEVKNQL